jgi:hypothetical protein
MKEQLKRKRSIDNSNNSCELNENTVDSDSDSFVSGMSLIYEENSNLSVRSQHAQTEEGYGSDLYEMMEVEFLKEETLRAQMLVVDIIEMIVNKVCDIVQQISSTFV